MSAVVAYGNESKIELAGIPPLLLEMHSAVSGEVAGGLADGIRQRAGTTIGLSITGIAGPTGGTPEKPVGTVHIAVAGPLGTDSQQFLFLGDRGRIRGQASQAALDLARRYLMKM